MLYISGIRGREDKTIMKSYLETMTKNAHKENKNKLITLKSEPYKMLAEAELTARS